MIKETDIQSQIVRDVKNASGFAYKASHRFLIGVPDLFIQLPNRPGCHLEVKRLRGNEKTRKINLTAHQRRFIDQLREAGGHAGWLVVAPAEKNHWRCYVGTGVMTNDVIIDHVAALVKRPGMWPVVDIVDAVVGGKRI